jgi:hypothetical protein
VGVRVEVFIFDRGEHPECAVASLTVVEDLEVFEDRVGEFDACPPALTVEQLGLHSAPERFDDRVIKAVADGLGVVTAIGRFEFSRWQSVGGPLESPVVEAIDIVDGDRRVRAVRPVTVRDTTEGLAGAEWPVSAMSRGYRSGCRDSNPGPSVPQADGRRFAAAR